MEIILDILKVLLGSALAFLVDWFLKDRTLKKLDELNRRERQKRNERLFDFTSNTVHLGSRDSFVCVIDGDGVSEFSPDNIIIRIKREKLKVPDMFTAEYHRVKNIEQSNRLQGKPYSWNGDTCHIKAFNPSKTADEEAPRLHISMQTGEYYHYIAANVRLFNNFPEEGFTSALRSEILGDFDKWRFEPAPNLLNILAANLFVLTDDGKLVFARRSASVAIGANKISTLINENLHPEQDFKKGSPQCDFRSFLVRSLKEEVGWDDDKHAGTPEDRKSSTHILAFVVHTGLVGYSLLGYSKLPVTFSELQAMFHRECRDRYETENLIAVEFTVNDVCRFVHENSLYDAVGIGCLYTLMHQNFKTEDIIKCFHKLQS